LMGYYSVLAFNINAFEQLPPPSDEPFLPVYSFESGDFPHYWHALIVRRGRTS